MKLTSVGVLLLAAFAATFHGWRAGRVLAPTDALAMVAPWGNADAAFVAGNENLLDQTVQFVPWMEYTKRRLQAGQIPLWNPFAGCGEPFLANGQSAVFYPATLLHLTLPPEWSWTISAFLRLFIAGLGAYVLAGRYGVLGWGRLLTGLAFMLCGFNVAWLNHPQMNVMPLLPWAVIMTEMLMQRVRLHRVAGAGLVFGVQFLGGHPTSCVHLLLTCAMVVLLRMIWPAQGASEDVRGKLARVAGAGAAVALGFALAAAQWLPLIEYANESGAKIVRAEKLAAEREKFFATDPRYLIGMLFPYANGYAPDGVTPFEMRLATKLPNTNELAGGYVGIVPLLLGIYGGVFAWRKRREARVWVVIGVTAVLIAVKFPGVDHLVRYVPVLNVSQNARLLVVAALALAILAGLGLQGLIEAMRNAAHEAALARARKWLLRAAVGLVGIGVLGMLVLWLAKGPILKEGIARAEAAYELEAKHENTIEHVRKQVGRVHLELILTCARLLIPAAVLGAMGWMMPRRRDLEGLGNREATDSLEDASGQTRMSAPPVGPWFWITLSAAELLAFAIPYNPGSPVETYFPQNVAAIETMRELPEARFAGTYRSFLPEVSTAYGLADIRSYDALAPWRYYKWWDHAGIGDLPARQQGYLQKMDDPDRPAWALLNFGYLVTSSSQPRASENWSPIPDVENAVVYQARTLRPRAWVARRADLLGSVDDVLDRVAKMDFKPEEVVLIDKEKLPADVVKRVEEGMKRVGAGSAMNEVTFLPPVKAGDERPEVVRMRVSGTGGWLVLADAFTSGWEAHVMTDRGIGRESVVTPAYGALRAVPFPAELGAGVIVELKYRPWSWRVGAVVSLLASGVTLLMMGCCFWRRR